VEDEEQNKCVACDKVIYMKEFQEDNKVCLDMPCGEIAHRKCMVDHFTEQNEEGVEKHTCPKCKIELDLEVVRKIAQVDMVKR